MSFFMVLLQLHGLGQNIVSGVVTSNQGEPLPFATIGFQGQPKGTISNKDGRFLLQIPDELSGTSLVINYLGYESQVIPSDKISSDMRIELIESVLQLDELVVRPLTPTDYIKRAVKQMGKNYASDPFSTRAYYREKFIENDQYVNMVEGYFKSFYPRYQDTIKNQHQLLLFRQVDDLHDIQFMSNWVDKRNKKKKKKAEKKDEEFEEDDPSEEIRKGFGGPENILSMDLLKSPESCIDSTLFKKFRYKFSNGVKFLDRELLVIEYESKGVVDHTRQYGKIFIDLKSDALVAIESAGEVIIPALVKPILFTIGLSIGRPSFEKKIRYQLHEGKWYPENFQWSVDIDIKKRHMFKSDEKSNFLAEQVLKVNDVQFQVLKEIEKEKIFDPAKDMGSQEFNDENLSWKMLNTLILEN